MAIAFENVKGDYAKTVEDSSHQAKEKFSNPIAKPADNDWTDEKEISKPADSGSNAPDTMDYEP